MSSIEMLISIFLVFTAEYGKYLKLDRVYSVTLFIDMTWMMSLFTWSVISSEDVLLVYLYGGFFNFRNVFYMKTEFI